MPDFNKKNDLDKNETNISNSGMTCEHVKPFSKEQLAALPKAGTTSLSSKFPTGQDATIAQIHQIYDPKAHQQIQTSIVSLAVAKNSFDQTTQGVSNNSDIANTKQQLTDTENALHTNAAQLNDVNEKIYANQDQMTTNESDMRRMEVDAKTNDTDGSGQKNLSQSQSYQALQQKQSELQQNHAALVQQYETTKAAALQTAQNADQLVQGLPSTKDLASSVSEQGKSQITSALPTTPPADACGITISEFSQKSPEELENLKTILSQGLPAFPGMPALPAVPPCNGLSQDLAARSGVQLSADLTSIPNLPAMPPIPALPPLPPFIFDGTSTTVPAGLMPSGQIPQIPAIPAIPALPAINAVPLDGSLKSLANVSSPSLLTNIASLSAIQPNLAQIQIPSATANPQISNTTPSLNTVAGNVVTPQLPTIPALPAMPQTPAYPGFSNLSSFAGQKIPSPTELVKLKDTLSQADYCRYCAFWTDIQSRVSTYQSFTDAANVGKVSHYSSIAGIVVAQVNATASQTTVAQQLASQQTANIAPQQPPSAVLAKFKDQMANSTSASTNACPNPDCPLSQTQKSTSPSAAELSENFNNPNPQEGILSAQPKIVDGGGSGNSTLSAHLDTLKTKLPKSSRPTEFYKADLEEACVNPTKMTTVENALPGASLVVIHNVDLLSDKATTLAAEIQRKVSAQGVSVMMTTTGRPITNPVTSALLEKAIYKDGSQVASLKDDSHENQTEDQQIQGIGRFFSKKV